MKKLFLLLTICVVYSVKIHAQKGSVVLIEEFTETGCGACAQYDSAFQAITRENKEKVAVLNFHCFYMLDTFYQYNKACDKRYMLYNLQGYPQAVANGLPGDGKSTHITGITPGLINRLYEQPPQFSFEMTSTSTFKNNVRNAKINIKAKALKDNPSKSLVLHAVVTENNINHEQRYKAKSVYGINEFNHIVRAFLPGIEGIPIGAQKIGKVNSAKVSFTNDEKEINYKEVQIVVFVQDSVSNEILGAGVMEGSPFK